MVICMHYFSSQLSEVFSLTTSFVPIIFSSLYSKTVTPSKIQGYANFYPPPCYQIPSLHRLIKEENLEKHQWDTSLACVTNINSKLLEGRQKRNKFIHTSCKEFKKWAKSLIKKNRVKKTIWTKTALEQDETEYARQNRNGIHWKADVPQRKKLPRN